MLSVAFGDVKGTCRLGKLATLYGFVLDSSFQKTLSWGCGPIKTAIWWVEAGRGPAWEGHSVDLSNRALVAGVRRSTGGHFVVGCEYLQVVPDLPQNAVNVQCGGNPHHRE